MDGATFDRWYRAILAEDVMKDDAARTRYEFLKDRCNDVSAEILNNTSVPYGRAEAISEVWHWLCMACISLKYPLSNPMAEGEASYCESLRTQN